MLFLWYNYNYKQTYSTMSQLSFVVSPTHGQSKGRDESLLPLAKKPPLNTGEVHVQVIPQEGNITWTTATPIQPR